MYIKPDKKYWYGFCTGLAVAIFGFYGIYKCFLKCHPLVNRNYLQLDDMKIIDTKTGNWYELQDKGTVYTAKTNHHTFIYRLVTTNSNIYNDYLANGKFICSGNWNEDIHNQPDQGLEFMHYKTQELALL
ncbi:MAG TPA: hypothetical protein VGW78_06815 [Candidatus Babeliales bacterium]|jgi:hypothetical protein|nr:hypothetical protein [Candidatus Babeliales bacterium]